MQKPHRLVFAAAITALPLTAIAAPQGQPVPKAGTCPLGYLASGSYCIPNPYGQSREAIQKVGGTCPLGWFTSGAYCAKNQ